MRAMGGNASGGTRTTAVKGPSAARARGTEMKTPEMTGTGGDDLEAFFGTSRVNARAGRGPDASNASSSSFDDLDALARVVLAGHGHQGLGEEVGAVPRDRHD